MKTITVWVMIHPTKWQVFIFELPAFACDLVQKGLADFYPTGLHEEYVQMIYAVGGGITMFYDSCVAI